MDRRTVLRSVGLSNFSHSQPSMNDFDYVKAMTYSGGFLPEPDKYLAALHLPSCDRVSIWPILLIPAERQVEHLRPLSIQGGNSGTSRYRDSWAAIEVRRFERSRAGLGFICALKKNLYNGRLCRRDSIVQIAPNNRLNTVGLLAGGPAYRS